MADSSLRSSDQDCEDFRIPRFSGKFEDPPKFKEDTEWWIEGLDLEATRRYNLGARFAARQTVASVESRVRSLRPADLRYQRATYVDGAGQACESTAQGAVLDVSEDLRSGVWKVVQVIEDGVYPDATAKKPELRDKFYREFQRLLGERVDAFKIRFDKAITQLRAVGVNFEDEDLAYFFKGRLNLSNARVEMLDTATGPDPTYTKLASETLRLFRRLHRVEAAGQDRFGDRRAQPAFARRPAAQPSAGRDAVLAVRSRATSAPTGVERDVPRPTRPTWRRTPTPTGTTTGRRRSSRPLRAHVLEPRRRRRLWRLRARLALKTWLKRLLAIG